MYLAQGIKYVIKIPEDFAFGDLCDIIHGLACVIADTSVLVGEAC